MKRLNFSKRAASKFRLNPEIQASQLPLLIEILRRPLNKDRRDVQTRIRAAYALHVVNAAAMPAKAALMNILKHTEDPACPVAAELVDSFGPTVDAIPGLIHQLQAESYLARERAAIILGRFRVNSESAVRALSSTFEKEIFRTVRYSIVVALGDIGSAHGLPVLNKALKDDYESVRVAAKDAIAMIQAAQKVKLRKCCRKIQSASEYNRVGG